MGMFIRGSVGFALGYLLLCTGHWLYASWHYGQLITHWSHKEILKGGCIALWHLIDKLPL